MKNIKSSMFATLIDYTHNTSHTIKRLTESKPPSAVILHFINYLTFSLLYSPSDIFSFLSKFPFGYITKNRNNGMYSANINIMFKKKLINIPLNKPPALLSEDVMNVINEVKELVNPNFPISKKQYKQKLIANKINKIHFAFLFSGASIFLLLKNNIAAAIAILDAVNK